MAGASSVLAVPAEVRRLEMLGHETIATLAVGPYELRARDPVRARLRAGDRMTIGLDPERATWFDPESGLAL